MQSAGPVLQLRQQTDLPCPAIMAARNVTGFVGRIFDHLCRLVRIMHKLPASACKCALGTYEPHLAKIMGQAASTCPVYHSTAPMQLKNSHPVTKLGKHNHLSRGLS